MKWDPVWLVIPLLILSIAIASGVVWKKQGFPARFSGELYMSKEEILANRKNYWQESNSKNTVLKGEEGNGHIIMLGNSHAIDMIYALRIGGLKSKITSLQTSGKCFNFGTAMKESDAEFCRDKRERNLANKFWGTVDAVYLHDHWPRLELEGFRALLDEIRTKTPAPIVVFGPKMIYKEQVPDIVSASGSIIPRVINEHAKRFAQKDAKVRINERLLEEFKKPFYKDNNIRYVDILHLQGGEDLDDFEIVSADGLKFLYFDASHLTAQGSLELGQKMKAAFPELFEIEIRK